jgi:hypothetical protein
MARRSGTGGALRVAGSLPPHQGWVAFGAFTLLVIVVASRAPAMIYWDENAYLARAAWGHAGLGAIRDQALDPDPLFITRGYPIFWAVVIAALSGGATLPLALLLAGSLALLVFATLYVGLCAERVRARQPFALLPLAGLVMTPLSLVHARTLYADLPLGLLIGAWTLLIVDRRSLGSIALVGVALGGMKDEGITGAVSGLAALLAVGATGASRRRRFGEVAAVGSALALILLWKSWSPTSGIPTAGHTFVAIHWDRIGDIVLRGFLRHATDIYSWGLLWGVAAGALVSTPWTWRRLAMDTRFLAVFVALHASGNFAAIAVAPSDVVEHVTALGIVANRLLLQELPAVLLFLAAFLRDVAWAETAESSRPAEGIGATQFPVGSPR